MQQPRDIEILLKVVLKGGFQIRITAISDAILQDYCDFRCASFLNRSYKHLEWSFSREGRTSVRKGTVRLAFSDPLKGW